MRRADRVGAAGSTIDINLNSDGSYELLAVRRGFGPNLNLSPAGSIEDQTALCIDILGADLREPL